MTMIQSTYQIDATAAIGKVVLKVANIEKMSQFYSDVIGLTLLEQSVDHARLGVGAQELLVLEKVSDPLPLTRKTGLFHTAFLLPSRKDLGNMLIHYLEAKAPLDGASDHGYSEALYLTDPEGNGIEVYRDKPMSEWDIRADGEIVGVTIEMDAQGVLGAADRSQTTFPVGTTVGHVHLKVADLAKTEEFYTEVLGMRLTSDFGSQAKFFAAGSYHHHIGSNIWMGRNVPAMEEQDLGLAYFTIVLPALAFSTLRSHLKASGVSYELETDSRLHLTDPNGINLIIERKNQP